VSAIPFGALLERRLDAVLARVADTSPQLRQAHEMPLDWHERRVILVDPDALRALHRPLN
jgi:hypothetical protein